MMNNRDSLGRFVSLGPRAEDFDVGEAVLTPHGAGRVVAFFPASKRPDKATYTVKLPHLTSAVPFWARELRRLQ